jgi:hypothetical protein
MRQSAAAAGTGRERRRFSRQTLKHDKEPEMPNWDEPRGRPGPFRGDWERRAWRHEARGHMPEPRSFDDPWEHERERGEGYREPRDAGAGGYRERARGVREDTRRYGEPNYRGQEYGLEGHGPEGRPASGFAGGPRRRGFDYDDPGVGQSAAGYGPEARSHEDHDHEDRDHEHDPDYLRWRDEQMRAHDRDYAEWRRAQHARYDEQYRQYRKERREHFSRSFHDWRSQRSMVGGIEDTTVVPGVSGYGDRSAIPGGYAHTFGAPRPDGRLDEAAHVNADPATTQTGGHPAPGAGARAGAPASPGPEFGKEPPEVQASADGDVRRDDDDRDRPRREGEAPRP